MAKYAARKVIGNVLPTVDPLAEIADPLRRRSHLAEAGVTPRKVQDRLPDRRAHQRRFVGVASVGFDHGEVVEEDKEKG